jgi:hypothetical protein
LYHEPDANLVLTVVKVLLALLPRAVMAVMQTTTIRANMTAYSTAVGPSSRWIKSFAARTRFRVIGCSLDQIVLLLMEMNLPVTPTLGYVREQVKTRHADARFLGRAQLAGAASRLAETIGSCYKVPFRLMLRPTAGVWTGPERLVVENNR